MTYFKISVQLRFIDWNMYKLEIIVETCLEKSCFFILGASYELVRMSDRNYPIFTAIECLIGRLSLAFLLLMVKQDNCNF